MKTSLKLGYGVGQTSSGVKNAAFAIFLFFYFNQVLGLSGSLAGMASLLVMQLLTPWLGSCPTDTNLAGAAAIHSC
jgi:Na+/melibiose symporter-like transporter